MACNTTVYDCNISYIESGYQLHRALISAQFVSVPDNSQALKELSEVNIFPTLSMRPSFRVFLMTIPLALLLGLGLAGQRAQAQVLKVGVYEQKPDIYITADGRASGILGELLTEVARREGWTLKIEPCPWQECMQWLQAGEIDLLPDVYYTPQRAEKLSFHHVPALHSWSQMYARQGSQLRAITDLKGQRVAVLAGSAQQDYLRNTLNNLGIDADLIPVQKLEDGFKMVNREQAEAVASDFYIGELTSREYGLSATSIVFQPTEAFFAAPKGRHATVLAALDHYLSLWQSDPESFYFHTLDNWRTAPMRPQNDSQPVWVIGGLTAALVLALLAALWLATRLSRAHRELELKNRHIQVILNCTDALVSIKSSDGRYLLANRRIETFYGVQEGHMLGRHDADFITDAPSLFSIRKSDQAVLDSGEDNFLQQTIRRPQDSAARTLLTTKMPLLDADGAPEAICVVDVDITERLLAERATHHLTYYDTLTNLPNRRTALDRLRQIIDSTSQDSSLGALLQIDLDGFKKINDTLGYQAGDQVLTALADRLRKNTREHDLVAHTSADEFVVLISNLSKNIHEAASTAIHIADKLRQAISSSALTIQNAPVLVTASIGLTLIHAGSNNSDTVMREADTATQRAKHHGGNQTTFYEQALQAEAEQRQWVERDLLQAIGSPDLSLHLQPQFDQQGRVTGGELLARWQHPEHGPISPAVFIPVAEESGLISLLGTWTLGIACDTLLTLQALGETYPLSINVSPKRLMEPRFVEHVHDTLERKGLPGNRLIFEVTEGVLIQDIQAVAQRMESLARLGIRFSIDDFGTGYSNLAYLKRLPLYELKIDKSLIQDLPDDNDSTAIVQLILAMADQLNLRVVAEGVETDEQAQVLFQNDCHALQGFLLARPMPIEAWVQQVRKRRQKPDED